MIVILAACAAMTAFECWLWTRAIDLFDYIVLAMSTVFLAFMWWRTIEGIADEEDEPLW